MMKGVVWLSLFLLWSPAFLLADTQTAVDLEMFLPLPGDQSEWQLDGQVQKAEGKQLFMLINGGATLYLSLGFKRALTATFKDRHGKPVNVDLFEMNSPLIAQRVNREKVGTEGRDLSIGHEGKLESYYLNFWQGPYQITVSGYDDTAASIDSITHLAGLIADNITRFASASLK